MDSSTWATWSRSPRSRPAGSGLSFRALTWCYRAITQ